MPGPSESNANTRSRTLWDASALLAIGWQGKHWIVLGLILGIVAGSATGMLLPRVYQSTAQISILKKRPDSVTGVDTRQLAAEDYLAPPQDLLKSSLIINQAIRSKEITSLSIFNDKEMDLVETIRGSLTVAAGKASPGQNVVLKLSYRAGASEDARAVLAAILDSFQEFIDKKHTTISVDSIELILREKQALQKSLEEKETAYRVFRETAPLLGNGKDGLELRQERLNSIQTKRSTLLLHRVELEGQLTVLETALKEGRSQEAVLALLMEFARKSAASEPNGERLVSLSDQLLPLLLEERKLREMYGAKHPEVLAVQNRIETARRLLVLPTPLWNSEPANASVSQANATDDPVALHLQILRQKLDHLKVSEELLAKVFQSEQDDARRLTSFEIQNDSFRTSIQLNQQLYEALVKRLNEASLIKNVGGYQVEMLEPPSLGKRVAPSMTIMLLVGSFFGVLVGFALAFWASYRSGASEPRT